MTINLYRGINWTGPEWHDPNDNPAVAGLTQSNISSLKTQWNINIFRLCFNRTDYLSNLNGVRDKIKDIATWCQDLGIVLILDHQWESYTGGTVWLPNKQATVDLWNNISNDAAFKNNSYVWFDIWNEPHDCTIDQWRDIANAAVQKIRDNGANNICLVAGIDWASTLKPWRGNYLPQSNVVYSCHVYYGGGPTSDLDNNIGLVLSDGKDVFVGETAPYWDEPFTDAQVNYFQNTLLPWLDGNNRGSGIPTTKIGFAAWAISSYAPASTLTNNDYITPTVPYGQIVKNKLLETDTNYYNTCDNGTCTQHSGVGTSNCNNPGQPCGTTPSSNNGYCLQIGDKCVPYIYIIIGLGVLYLLKK